MTVKMIKEYEEDEQQEDIPTPKEIEKAFHTT
jgi:hypothetical protein